MTEVVGPFWKSSYSGTQSNCIEVARTAPGGLAVRDSKLTSSPLLATSRETWASFLGQFGDNPQN
ncbi:MULTISPECIES: DUF397 domain-containing protein [unclassified Streptomyces]|uniref:DUF397 domain-containing protein n=1 Tax=unclassified Streptomyces TaxID=2593676 RepID=UPI000DD535D5|nr:MULTISPECIES: DUF397 domain-containing protein [unclassified Streptomyces]QZZ29164.1 DUF397 domain-containing protein [Streptomyces sp. ST1015]